MALPVAAEFFAPCVPLSTCLEAVNCGIHVCVCVCVGMIVFRNATLNNTNYETSFPVPSLDVAREHSMHPQLLLLLVLAGPLAGLPARPAK